MTRTQESTPHRYAGIIPGVFILACLIGGVVLVLAHPDARNAFGAVAGGILALLGLGVAGFAALLALGLAVRAALVRRGRRS